MKKTWLLDSAAIFVLACVLVAPLFRLEYLNIWTSIESFWITDARIMAEHLPQPKWEPLWYCGNRYAYLYPPDLRLAVALISRFSGASPARSYHFYVGVLYALGVIAVYLLTRTGSGSRWTALLAAALVALVSPSLLLIPEIRHDSLTWEPQRLHVMMMYGEGPHISSLSILLGALTCSFIALRNRRPVMLALTSLLAALAVSHNFWGATALAIFFALAVWAAWLVDPGWPVFLRAAAIVALAYGLCAYWLTPSYLSITASNLHWVSAEKTSSGKVIPIVAVLLFAVASYRFAYRRSGAMWWVFISGAATVFASYVLPYYYFKSVAGALPGRLVPELDIALILVFAAIVFRMWKSRKFRAAAAVAVVLAFVPAVRYVRHTHRPFPASGPLSKQYEYRIAKWAHQNLPGQRVMATGTVRFWYDVWFDNAQPDGLSLQAMENQILPTATYQLAVGDRADLATLWLQALGTDAIIVPDNTSPEQYHDFHKPEKFRGALQALYDDHAGTVIYRVPRLHSGIGRLISTAKFAGIGPIHGGDDIDALSRYVAVVEDPSRGPAQVNWRGFDSFDVNANAASGEAILIQETYDPAWHAYADGRPVPIRRDPIVGFMILDAAPGLRNIHARFETPFEYKIGAVVSAASILLLTALLGSGIVAKKPASGSPLMPAHLRFLRTVLRRLNYHLGSHPDTPREPFDQDRLKQAEEALRQMPMPDVAATAYLTKHIPRLSRTLALVPPPQKTSRVLELGCYMQITPLLQRVCGYREVRGAYYGTLGRTDHKTMRFPDGEFSCDVDHFNADRDRFPYPDESFDLVIAGEIIEHLTYDPMHMLLEARRVLVDGGYLLVTTPNVGSITSVAKTLDGHDNPQIFFLYERPQPGKDTDIGHVREYTVYELGEAVKAAGFEVVQLFTTFIEEFASHRPLLKFLEENGYTPENRGEQSWCLAMKRSALPIDRYPYFIYNP